MLERRGIKFLHSRGLLTEAEMIVSQKFADIHIKWLDVKAAIGGELGLHARERLLSRAIAGLKAELGVESYYILIEVAVNQKSFRELAESVAAHEPGRSVRMLAKRDIPGALHDALFRLAVIFVEGMRNGAAIARAREAKEAA